MIEQAQTVEEAFARYMASLEAGMLVQAKWHASDASGRELTCALGVLGPDVDRPASCPPSIMPQWLAQLVPVFFDGQDIVNAKAWGLRLYGELRRLDGRVPFSVVYDWQANVAIPLMIEVSEMRGGSAELHRILQMLHLRALMGLRPRRAEWIAALKPALHELYRCAFAYATAYARAHQSAIAYATAETNSQMIAEHFGSAEAYASYYAGLATDANMAAFAEANTRANADVAADAYANADTQAYAETFAYANARLYAQAYANSFDNVDARLREAFTRLASGLERCLAKVKA